MIPGRPPSGKSSTMNPITGRVTIPGDMTMTHTHDTAGQDTGRDTGRGDTGRGYTGRDSLPYSCPRCDKMYPKSRDLDIHLSYCNT